MEQEVKTENEQKKEYLRSYKDHPEKIAGLLLTTTKCRCRRCYSTHSIKRLPYKMQDLKFGTNKDRQTGGGMCCSKLCRLQITPVT